MGIEALIGGAAALASMASFAPQAWKVVSTRDVTGLSAPMYALTVAAFALWVGYGLLRSDFALILPNAFCLVASAFILGMVLVSARTRTDIADMIEEQLPGTAQSSTHPPST